MPSEPAAFLEVERTYDVDDDTPLPDLDDLPGVTRVAAPELRALDARYLDSGDLALATAGVAVRRRSGGPDEGWHVKVTVPGGREEYHWPLEDDEGDVPIPPLAVTEAVMRWTAAPLHPISRVRNRRTAYLLLDERDRVVAEFVDDRVDALDERRGRPSSWREWEMELGPAGPADPEARAAFFAAVDAAVGAVGGHAATSDSKLGRTLTH